MKRTLWLILLSISVLSASFFLASESFASPCTWWSSTSCTDPSRITTDCGAGGCTITGGVRIVDTAVGRNLSGMTISNYITTVVRYFLGFVTLIAVIYVIYAGFRLMTSGGDEEQSKKARRIIIYVMVGIIIMWAAYWIVRIMINALDRPMAESRPIEIESQEASYI